jgi:hypothetical protein
MFLFGFLAGVAVGAIVIGVLANRRPQWFAKVVAASNVVANQVNTVANTVSGGKV